MMARYGFTPVADLIEGEVVCNTTEHDATGGNTPTPPALWLAAPFLLGALLRTRR